MPANSGIGPSLPIPAQANAGDIYVLQTSAGNILYQHDGIAWQRVARYVPISPLQAVTVNGTGDVSGLTNLSLASAGVPAGAIAVSCSIKLASTVGAATAVLQIYRDAGATFPIGGANLTGNPSTYEVGSAIGPCNGSSVAYSIINTSGATWTFSITPTGYWT